MAASADSGKSLPAGFAASYLKVMVDLIGRHGADAVLRRSGLEAWIGWSEPTLSSEALDFAQASAWLSGLEETLGTRGARGLGRRMGAQAFHRVLRPVGAVAAMRDPEFQTFPIERRLRVGMYGLARSFGPLTATTMTVRETPEAVSLKLEVCPDCWGRTSSSVGCSPMLGLIGAAAAWIAPDVETRLEEATCRAQGASACEFLVRWEAAG